MEQEYTMKQVQTSDRVKTLPLYNQKWNEEKQRWEGDVKWNERMYPATGQKHSTGMYWLYSSKEARDVS